MINTVLNMKTFFLITWLMVVGLMSISCEKSDNTDGANSVDLMGHIMHNVYFYFHDEVTNEERIQFESDLKILLEIPYIKSSVIGRPAQTDSRPVTDHDFDYSVTMWFESVEDHDLYQIDPVHKQMVESTGDLLDRVRVMDSEIIYKN